jgi:hypothetical protein
LLKTFAFSKKKRQKNMLIESFLVKSIAFPNEIK